MPQWGNTDDAANSVLWAPAQFNKAPNTANRDELFNNTTVSAFVTGEVIGQFGVDTTEIGVATGNVIQSFVITAGSGYTANAVVTVTAVNGGTGAVANAQANSTGRIIAVNIANAGASYTVAPTIAIAAPANTTFNANSAVTAGPNGGANSVITISSAGRFIVNDKVLYQVAAGNTAIGGLANGTNYFIQFANSTVVALSAQPGGDRITLTKGLTETGHALQGETATGAVIISGGQNLGIAHAGWNVRTVGTGGRAGRVQYETLVAMSSLSGDAEDTVNADS